MNLEVGEYYLTASGEIVKIVLLDNYKQVYRTSDGKDYRKDGRYLNGFDFRDLIAHIPKELHFHICQMIATYHTQPKFTEKVNEVFEIFNKKGVIDD